MAACSEDFYCGDDFDVVLAIFRSYSWGANASEAVRKISSDEKDYRKHCVKSVRIRSYSSPYFSAFELNTERYSVSLRIQSECGKIRTRITPNTDTFYAVKCSFPSRHEMSLRDLNQISIEKTSQRPLRHIS